MVVVALDPSMLVAVVVPVVPVVTVKVRQVERQHWVVMVVLEKFHQFPVRLYITLAAAAADIQQVPSGRTERNIPKMKKEPCSRRILAAAVMAPEIQRSKRLAPV